MKAMYRVLVAVSWCAAVPGGSMAQGLCGAAGGDLVMSHIEGVSNYAAAGDYDFFALGTRQTNVGSVPLTAELMTAVHPVQAGNLYRHSMAGGVSRFEQIGMGWCFHAGIPLNMGGFCTCQGGSGSVIGPGCSDPHSASAVGTVQNLGPRWEVNAATGAFAHPHALPSGSAAGRIRFALSDVNPALNPAATYFGEVVVLHPDEDPANTVNNASWRPITVFYGGGNTAMGVSGAVQPGAAAIEAWKTLVSGVSEAALDVPGDGRFIIAARAVRIGGNRWNYEYAVYNLNSHRGGRAFILPRPEGLAVAETGFHDVDYHSGDGPGGANIVGTDWLFAETGESLRWETEPEEANASANALRWGTLYNFRLTCNMSPIDGEPSIELFRAGEPGSLSAGLPVPGAAACLGDHDGDGLRAVPDIFGFLADWFAQHAAGDADGDGANTVPDIFLFLSSWFGGC